MGVTVTASMIRCSATAVPRCGIPEGVAPRVVVKTKPESIRKQEGNRNVIPIKDLEHFSPERRSGVADERRLPLRSAPPHPHPSPLHTMNPAAVESAADEMISWLRTEDLGLRSPAISESARHRKLDTELGDPMGETARPHPRSRCCLGQDRRATSQNEIEDGACG